MEYATQNGSATDGEDYAGDHWFLEFNGETDLSIEIPIWNDAVLGCDETFGVTLFNPDAFDTKFIFTDSNAPSFGRRFYPAVSP